MFLFLFSSISSRADLTIYTSELPPYVMNNGESGIAVDILNELFLRSKIKAELLLTPNARAIHQAQISLSSCAFPIQRSQKRESEFSWIGPIFISQSAIFTLENSKVDITVLDDVGQAVIGVLLGSSDITYLKNRGLQVEEAHNEILNARKLRSKRFKYWASDSLAAPFLAGRTGVSIRKKIIFRKSLRALACNKNLDPKIVKVMNDVLTRMYKDGTIERIRNKYLKTVAYHSNK